MPISSLWTNFCTGATNFSMQTFFCFISLLYHQIFPSTRDQRRGTLNNKYFFKFILFYFFLKKITLKKKFFKKKRSKTILLLTQASPLTWFFLDGDKTSDNYTQIHPVLFPSFLEINSYQEKDNPYFPI